MQRFAARLVSAAAAATLSALAASTSASAQSAQDPAAFYKTHTVHFVSGGGPGGGYDTYARMLAPHLAKVLGTNVVVENQPGAGGLVGLNNLYVNDPDGLQLIIMNGGGAVLSQLFNLQTVQYDLRKVTYLATVSSSPWLILVKNDSPIHSVADFKKTPGPIRWPSTGPIDGLSDGASMICEAYALPCRVVMGYKSSSEGALAVTRGEMDALYVSDTSANNYTQRGDIRAVAVISRERSQFYPDMKTVFEEGNLTPQQEWWLGARADVDALGRIILATDKAPPARLAYMQDAIRKVLTDPDVIAEGAKFQRYVQYQDPEATKKRALGLIAGTPDDRKEQLKNVVMKKYLPGG